MHCNIYIFPHCCYFSLLWPIWCSEREAVVALGVLVSVQTPDGLAESTWALWEHLTLHSFSYRPDMIHVPTCSTRGTQNSHQYQHDTPTIAHGLVTERILLHQPDLCVCGNNSGEGAFKTSHIQSHWLMSQRPRVQHSFLIIVQLYIQQIVLKALPCSDLLKKQR